MNDLHSTPPANLFNGFSDAWEHSPHTFGSSPYQTRSRDTEAGLAHPISADAEDECQETKTPVLEPEQIIVLKRGQQDQSALNTQSFRRRSSAKIHALIHGNSKKLQKKSRAASPRASMINVNTLDTSVNKQEPKKSFFGSIKTKVATTLRGRQ